MIGFCTRCIINNTINFISQLTNGNTTIVIIIIILLQRGENGTMVFDIVQIVNHLLSSICQTFNG